MERSVAELVAERVRLLSKITKTEQRLHEQLLILGSLLQVPPGLQNVVHALYSGIGAGAVQHLPHFRLTVDQRKPLKVDGAKPHQIQHCAVALLSLVSFLARRDIKGEYNVRAILFATFDALEAAALFSEKEINDLNTELKDTRLQLEIARNNLGNLEAKIERQMAAADHAINVRDSKIQDLHNICAVLEQDKRTMRQDLQELHKKISELQAELDCFERKSSFPAGASFPPARPEEHAKSSGQAEHYQKRTSYSRDFLLKFQKRHHSCPPEVSHADSWWEVGPLTEGEHQPHPGNQHLVDPNLSVMTEEEHLQRQLHAGNQQLGDPNLPVVSEVKRLQRQVYAGNQQTVDPYLPVVSEAECLQHQARVGSQREDGSSLRWTETKYKQRQAQAITSLPVPQFQNPSLLDLWCVRGATQKNGSEAKVCQIKEA